MSDKSKQNFLIFMMDGCSVVLGIVLSFLVCRGILHRIPHYVHSEWYKYWLFSALAFYLSYTLTTPQVGFFQRNKARELLTTVQLVGLFLLLQAGFMLVGNCKLIDSRFLFCGSAIGILLLTYIFHLLYRKLHSVIWVQSDHATLIGAVSTKAHAGVLLETLKEANVGAIKEIVLIDSVRETVAASIGTTDTGRIPIPTDDFLDGIPVFHSLDTFQDWIKTEPLDEVYLDIPSEAGESLRPLIETMEDMGIVIHLCLPVLEPYIHSEREFLHKSYTMVGNLPAATFSATPTTLNPRQMVWKRVMDLIGGLVGTILSAPIILLTAIPLLIESPGPLIFKQARVGRNGRIFTMYKLRSMYADAEERKKELMSQNEMSGLMFKMTDDPRITKVGKFIRKTSIDELPQFWNVLKGDMSLVGTRPPTLDEYNQYKARHKRRLSMKPGITGMWQVSGRNDISDFEEVVRLDLSYIDHWTIWTDVRILFQTVFVVLKNRGAK